MNLPIVMQSSKMTSKYILQRYNKDVKSSQEKNNGEENIQNYSEDVSSDEDVHKDIEYSQEKKTMEKKIPKLFGRCI